MLLFSEFSIGGDPAPMALAGFMFLIGASIGSFLNVVAYRVPLGLSIVFPASRCPRCGAAIRSRDNVPILGWLMLRGRCRDCKASISARYPIVELMTGLMFFSLAWAEWPLEGDNLPGLPTTLEHRYGIFAYQIALLLGLLAMALMEFDGHAGTKFGILLGLTGVLVGAVWLFLHPISPPFTMMRERPIVSPAMLGFVDGLVGWVVGIVMGCLAATITDRGPAALAGRNSALVALAAVGAYLGWQAGATLAAASVGLYTLMLMYRAGWRRLAVVPFCGVLWALTWAWLIAWRPIADRYPIFGSRADHRTLIFAGAVVLLCGGLSRLLVRQRPTSAEVIP